MAADDREKALGIALAQIEKQFGKGSVMRLGDEGRAPVAVIPTGSIALDVALGIGGLPRGRVIEIYGPESSGKTTVTLHAVANVQAAGGIALMIEAVGSSGLGRGRRLVALRRIEGRDCLPVLGGEASGDPLHLGMLPPAVGIGFELAREISDAQSRQSRSTGSVSPTIEAVTCEAGVGRTRLATAQGNKFAGLHEAVGGAGLDRAA